MLSLKKLLIDQSITGIDLGDRKPADLPKSLPSKPSKTESEEDEITMLLNSASHSEVLFALSIIQNECIMDQSYVQYIPLITNLFSQPSSRMLKFALTTTLESMVVAYPKQVAKEAFPTILQQIQKLPAVEFVNCLIKLIPNLDDSTIKSLISQILVFLKSNEEYQFAACLILEEIPFDQSFITTYVFTQFLQSPVLITKFLPNIVKKTIALMGDKWAESFLIPQLISLANSKDYARAGTVKTFLQNTKQFTERNSYSFLLSAMGWAQSSENIAIEVVENCEHILKYKKSEFGSKIKDFVLKLQTSQDKSLRSRVIKVIVDKPYILTSENNIRSFIKNACEDTTAEVRCTFIENIMKISKIFNTAEMKELIFNFFATFFNDTNESVRSLLTTTPYYTKIGNQKLQYLIPSFIKFATTNLLSVDVLSSPKQKSILVKPSAHIQKIDVKWRHFAACVRLFNSFPDSVVISGLQSMTNAVNQMTVKSPNALRDACLTFYSRVLFVAKPDQIEWLVTTAINCFAYSEIYAVRRMFIDISYTMCFSVKYEFFIENVWIIVSSMVNDSVSTVRAGLALMLPRFSAFFKQQSDSEMENVVVALNNALSKDKDPLVQAAWEKAQSIFSKSTIPDSAMSDITTSTTEIESRDAIPLFNSLPIEGNISLPLLDKKQRRSSKFNYNLLQVPSGKSVRVLKCSSGKFAAVVTPLSKKSAHRFSNIQSPTRFL
jgi:hypothetical protein